MPKLLSFIMKYVVSLHWLIIARAIPDDKHYSFKTEYFAVFFPIEILVIFIIIKYY